MALVVKNLPANERALKKLRLDPWVGKIPWRRAWQPTLVSLPGDSHGQRSLAGYRQRSRKESDMTERLSAQNRVQCAYRSTVRVSEHAGNI